MSAKNYIIAVIILLLLGGGITLLGWQMGWWLTGDFSKKRLTGPSFEDCAKQGYNQGICCGQACQGNSDPNCIDKCRMVGPK